jgi:hypothetical protein
MTELPQELQEAFDDWFYAEQGFSVRAEYFYGDCHYPDDMEREKIMKSWVEAAFFLGYSFSQKGEL